jgi:transcriptional regulator with XRE-family HTH domain
MRREREKLGLTQEQLAERADLGPVHLRNIERATKNITLATLIAIADGLGVRPAILLRPARLPPLRPGRPRRKRVGGQHRRTVP